MNCPACSHTLSPGARFCNKCGTLVSQPAPALDLAKTIENTCPNCSKSLKPGARFCTACGTSIVASGTAAVVATAVKTTDFDPSVGVAGVAGSVEDIDAQDTIPGGLQRSHIDSLPLHPIQRGMPDFELPASPEPRVKAPAAATVAAAAPVTFDSFDDFEEPKTAPSSQQGGGSGLKWVIVGVLALAVVGGGGWFGYQHFAGGKSQAAKGAQPTVNDVAEGESVVPASGAEPAPVAVEAQDAAAGVAEASEAAAADAQTATTPVAVAADPAPVAQANQPVPVTVQPVHVLQDTPGGGVVGGGVAPRPERRKSNNASLDSLLD